MTATSRSESIINGRDECTSSRYQPFVTVLSQTAHRWRSAFLKTLSLFRQSGTQDPAILQEIHPAPLSCRNNPVAGIMTVITLAE
jgi:hypothetical protein